MKVLRAFLSLCALMLVTQIAYADSAQRGQLFAQKNCSSCHAIGMSGESPNPRSPPFRVISHKYPPRELEEALSEGIVVSHDLPMPQFELDPGDIEDLIVYLEKLRRETRANSPPQSKGHFIRRASN